MARFSRFVVALAAFLSLSSTSASAQQNQVGADATTSAGAVASHIGRRVSFVCPAITQEAAGSVEVYGTDLYTSDSPVCVAAIHAGVLQLGQAGVVTIQLTSGADTFAASTRNGVTTKSYGAWGSTYRYDRSGEPGQIDWSTTGMGIPETFTSSITLVCPAGGAMTYPVWGTDVYSDDSSICIAGVHAGMIQRDQGGKVLISRAPGQTEYPTTARNGVTSTYWGEYSASFRVGAPSNALIATAAPGVIVPGQPAPIIATTVDAPTGTTPLEERAPAGVVNRSITPVPTSPTLDTIAPSAGPREVSRVVTGKAILVGTGIADITGPIAEVGMMGYGSFSQKDTGLYMRLYARAYVFANEGAGKRVVFVSAELGQLFGAVKSGVLRRLAARYGTLYDDRNVMISATHTHAGPGGYSGYAMYNLTTLGFVRQNFNAIVDGITNAIVQAHESVAPATLSLAVGGIVDQISVNRSQVAFDRNPETKPLPELPPGAYIVEPNSWDPVIKEMAVLGIQRNGRRAGAISWFPVHNTSLTNTNLLVGSDHKGFAAYLFERANGTIAPFVRPGEFVAAFPNGSEGDLSPAIGPNFTGPTYDGGAPNEFESVEIIGYREYASAERLFTGTAQTPIAGDVDFRHAWVMMPGLRVTSTDEKNGEGGNTLCVGAYGLSFMAGAEDGPAGMGVTEGQVFTATSQEEAMKAKTSFASKLPAPLGDLLNSAMMQANDPCQSPKPVVIRSGFLKWTPDILPFQIFRLGPLAIVGIPGEMTAQAGRRLQFRLLTALAPLGVQRVILTGLANEYSGYVTTPQEYDSQQYEGASTLFGRLTFEAYAQTFGQLAEAMAAGQDIQIGPPAPDMSIAPQIELQTGVVFDDKLAGEQFGQVLVQPPSVVARDQTVSATFRSGHPKNDLKTGDTYARVERQVGDGWELVAWDSMPETMVIWSRSPAGVALSAVEVRWRVPRDAPAGTYRIKHSGKFKPSALAPNLADYEGTSDPFEVR